MKFQIKKKLGESELVFEGDVTTHVAFFRDTRFIYDLPTECGSCKSQNLRVQYRAPQGYEYCSVECNDCKYELKFGIHNNGQDTVFAKTWEAPYEQGAAESGEYQNSPQESESRPAPRRAPAAPAPRAAAPAPRAPAPAARPAAPAQRTALPVARPAAPAPARPAAPVARPAPRPVQALPPQAPPPQDLTPEQEAQLESEAIAQEQAEQDAAEQAPTTPATVPDLNDRVSKLKAQYGIPTNGSKLAGVRR